MRQTFSSSRHLWGETRQHCGLCCNLDKLLDSLPPDSPEELHENHTRTPDASPIVVRMVPAKKMDCPKLQLGSLDTLPTADTPRLFASMISTMNASSSPSAKNKTKSLQLTIFRGHFTKNNRWRSAWIYLLQTKKQNFNKETELEQRYCRTVSCIRRTSTVGLSLVLRPQKTMKIRTHACTIVLCTHTRSRQQRSFLIISLSTEHLVVSRKAFKSVCKSFLLLKLHNTVSTKSTLFDIPMYKMHPHFLPE